MWASAPTNDLTKLHDFRGRTESSAPTRGMKNHARPAKKRRVFHFAPGRADVGIGPYMRRYFRFHIVGVDAYIDPPKAPILWWFSGETVLISHPTL